MPPRVRVALCDDHAVVRSGLAHILVAEDDFEVVGQVGTAADAVRLAGEQHPDVFVMDLGLPDASGLDATRRVLEASPDTRVLVLTVQDDVAYLRKAFAAGAAGYLVKEAADIELVEAVREVASGGRYVHPTLGAALLAPPAEPVRPAGPGGELSAREIDVLRLIALGHTQSDIADRLYISARTVESHRAHIHQKLGLRTRADLVAFARQSGILHEDDGG